MSRAIITISHYHRYHHHYHIYDSYCRTYEHHHLLECYVMESDRTCRSAGKFCLQDRKMYAFL